MRLILRIFSCLILCMAALVFSGCDEDELTESIFIKDDQFKELPAYSEWGYNTFGAFYDRKAFTSTYDEVPMKVIVSSTGTDFHFTGRVDGGFTDNEMSMTIYIPGYTPSHYEDLVEINQKTFDLETDNVIITVTNEGDELDVSNVSGFIEFRRVQHLFIDKDPFQVILSGTFEMEALIDNHPSSITHGRFDAGINADNFYLF